MCVFNEKFRRNKTKLQELNIVMTYVTTDNDIVVAHIQLVGLYSERP